MRGMQSHTRNAPLCRFLGMILSVADDGVSQRRKLHTNLILQSRHQRDADKEFGTDGTDPILKSGWPGSAI